MDIRFYNTLEHRLESFEPIEAGCVRMYHCGPTVYDYAHIGNFRAFLLADLLRRFFEFAGYRVQQVMNITDVGHMTEDQLADGGGEDKIVKSMRERGLSSPYEVATYFTEAFLVDARALGLKIAGEFPQHMPRATDHVPGMIRLIKRLIAADHAYIAESGAVYYDVRSFPQYGRLSGNTLESLQAGAGGRVSADQLAGKRHPADFLLWKPDDQHLMKWDSPWGRGYPGWHVECSTMAMDVLGVETLDIHTGGEDNIFPHHECEIAQSTGATGKPFAKYWLHGRFLLVEGQKMSKSKGNFYTARDLFARGVEPTVLRYELMRTHYRSNLNFTQRGLEDSQKAVSRLRAFAARQTELSPQEMVCRADDPVLSDFQAALADDLNISEALGVLFTWVGRKDHQPAEARGTLAEIDKVLGVMDTSLGQDAKEAKIEVESGPSDDAVAAKCAQIDEARSAKNYAQADAIRSELEGMGIDVQTTREGTSWRRQIRLGDS